MHSFDLRVFFFFFLADHLTQPYSWPGIVVGSILAWDRGQLCQSVQDGCQSLQYNDLAFAINTRGTSHGTKSLDWYITHNHWTGISRIFTLSYTFWILEYFTRLRLITSYVTMNIKLRSFLGKYWFSVDKYSHLFVDIHSALRGNGWDGLRVVLRDLKSGRNTRTRARLGKLATRWNQRACLSPAGLDNTRSRNLQKICRNLQYRMQNTASQLCEFWFIH